MKKIILPLVLGTTLLSACTIGMKKESPVVPADKTSTQATIPAPNTPTAKREAVEVGAMVSVNYVLHLDSKDGKVEDTNMESVAKQSGTYKTGAMYQPLPFVVGAGRMIPGFEKGIMGMKVGEKKTFEVKPEDAYGTGSIEKLIKKELISPVMTETVDKKLLEDVVTETLPVEQLGDQGKDLAVGKKIQGGNNIEAEVTALGSGTVTIKIKNQANPFLGKEKTVGAISENDEAKFKIVGVSATGITLEVTNKRSPFYGKDFKVGTTVTTPNKEEITIRNISNSGITIDYKHPLAGKTLYFDAEIISIQ